jgi:hypothetical protein
MGEPCGERERERRLDGDGDGWNAAGRTARRAGRASRRRAERPATSRYEPERAATTTISSALVPDSAACTARSTASEKLRSMRIMAGECTFASHEDDSPHETRKSRAAVPGSRISPGVGRRGSEDALRMGRTLAKLGAVPDAIVASPALRAKETAEAAARR